jgi:dTDP-4-dehydrorhamnose reductase
MPPEAPTLLVLGRSGQVGHALTTALAPLGRVVAAGRADLDLADLNAIAPFVAAHAPDVLVNAAAYTAVDRAEEEPARARRVNAEAPGALAEAAAEAGAWLVHYSTDYVFDGTKGAPYTEADPAAPVNVYGRTKRAGERAIVAAGGRHLILRTSWVYSARGRNFLRTMLRLAATHERLTVVDDQVGCPTWAGWLAEATATLVEAVLARGGDARQADDLGGVYHLSSAGATSWCGFARAIMQRFGHAGVEVAPIPTTDYPTPAPRPAYSVLATGKAERTFGLAVPPWEAQLATCHAQMQAVPEAGADGARADGAVP